MTSNYQLMNDSKTETVPVVPKSASAIVSGLFGRIGAAEHVSNRCVHFEKHLDLNLQVTQR